MLSSFTRDLAGAPDGYDALLLVQSLPETLGHAVVLQVHKNLNMYTQTHQSLELRELWLYLL